MSATLYIARQYPRDVTMVCAYFSREVVQIHSSAQYAGQKSRRKRRQIYSAESSGSGLGHFGNCGYGSRRGYGRSYRRGRRGSVRNNIDDRGISDFNGINIFNPTRAFINKEWTALGSGVGQAHFTQQ